MHIKRFLPILRYMKRFILYAVLFMFVFLSCTEKACAQSISGDGVKIAYDGGDYSYVMYERSDVRRYDNGRYTGLASREVRSMVNPIDPPKGAGFQNDFWFKGNFMVMEEVNSSSIKLKPFNSMYPTTFHISSNGTLTVVPGYNDDHTYRRDAGFPTFRSFPSYPAGEVHPGDSWTSNAYRAVDPLGTGVFTKLQIVVQYTYVGDEIYKGIPCRKITAKWATRYGNGTLYHDYDGDPTLTGAQGTHTADIMVSVETGAAIVISDRYDETFTYKDGSTVRFAGTCTQFTEYTPSIDRNSVISTLGKVVKVEQTVPSDQPPAGSGATQQNPQEQGIGQKSAVELLRERLVTGGTTASGTSGTSGGTGGSDSNGVNGSTAGSSYAGGTGTGNDESSASNMVIEETDIGVRLSVRDIRFVADSARILSEESWRLDAIADVLKQLPGRIFLIEGHAASTGNAAGEQTLSVERAKAICEELIKRGIAEEQLTYTGYGSTRPVADNSTSEGKAQNRRVEITILD